MELDTIRLLHWGWTSTNGWTSPGRVYEFDELPTKMKERFLPYV